jgi:hypothetical protein
MGDLTSNHGHGNVLIHEKSLTISDVERIARLATRSEISQIESEKYFLKLLIGDDFRIKVIDIVNNHLPKSVSPIVKSTVHEVLATAVPPLVKGELYERISTLSGVETLMKEHKEQIQEMLNKISDKFYHLWTDQLESLKSMKTVQYEEFSRDLKLLIDATLKKMVGDNGSILQAFKDELAARNATNFKSFSERMESQMTNVTYLSLACGFVSVATVAYLLFKK